MKTIKISLQVLLVTIVFSCKEGDRDAIISADSIEIPDEDRKPFDPAAPVILGPDEVERNKPFSLQIANCDYEGVSIVWSPALSCPDVRITPCGLCALIERTTTFSVTVRQGPRQSAIGYKTVHVKD
ncbi:hypothetical protein [Dyadobacter sp. LHD-138]|uniref:hypothetical protein n=1 Tax=Dyadobacter sp. LHD-138 TaxID=3071413 RepID=UPI0027E07987|nr:hypothetical protein [Dyadobacter sp. LHD-138]MDQ6481851.1 hypothetical protein [Dyadobacter sp. LHD-138]